DRDTLNLHTLPENELRLSSISRGLPLFTHALEEDFKDLFQLLRANASVTVDYLILMISATLLALLGLFLDSPVVLIGAMLLAPLMAPIVSLSMGILRRGPGLRQASARAIVIGAAVAFGTATLFALLLP